MTEIKFRAWDKKEKVMLQVGDKFGTTSPLDCANYKRQGQDIVLMQFTGLKDRKGVEIYEGDIVEYFDWYYCQNSCSGKKGEKQIKQKFTDAYGNTRIDCYVPLVGVVKWNEKALTYEPLVDSCEDYNANSFGYVCGHNENFIQYPDSYIEVIGNIYEHPKLFKEEK